MHSLSCLDNFLRIIIQFGVITFLAMHYAGRQEVHKRLLDDTDSGDNVISPHIIYDLEDRPEKLTESLRILSQVNITPCSSVSSYVV